MSIGVRPTFGGVLRTIEVFLLDFAGDLYGQSLTIAFADWLRGEEKFAGVEPLVAQMHRDVAEARVRLEMRAAPTW
jgi:riboflavin kinase/FMN adenylyltransferase